MLSYIYIQVHQHTEHSDLCLAMSWYRKARLSSKETSSFQGSQAAQKRKKKNVGVFFLICCDPCGAGIFFHLRWPFFCSVERLLLQLQGELRSEAEERAVGWEKEREGGWARERTTPLTTITANDGRTEPAQQQQLASFSSPQGHSKRTLTQLPPPPSSTNTLTLFRSIRQAHNLT